MPVQSYPGVLVPFQDVSPHQHCICLNQIIIGLKVGIGFAL
jgi:hypothetical protein